MRLRGLPFDSTVQDVLTFLALHGVVDKVADILNAAELVSRASGRPSGQADILIKSLRGAIEARDVLEGKYFGDRWIEAFVSGATKEEERQQRTAELNDSGHPCDRLDVVQRIKAWKRSSRENYAVWQEFSAAYGFADPERHKTGTLRDFALKVDLP